jgi:transposase
MRLALDGREHSGRLVGLGGGRFQQQFLFERVSSRDLILPITTIPWGARHQARASRHNDEVCRRLMTIPGVGPVVALTYRVTVDVPARFRNSKSVGAVFGLTPAKDQSGERDRSGAISRCGDEMMRVMLYEAAQIMLVRSAKWSWLKAWAMKIARHRGMKKAIVALARRLAVIMHRMWVDGTEFRWTREVAAA